MGNGVLGIFYSVVVWGSCGYFTNNKISLQNWVHFDFEMLLILVQLTLSNCEVVGVLVKLE